MIQSDGSISRGAQNLPSIGGAGTLVLMNNDAVVQGLSELPFTRDVRRWAVLIIVTGLGNASFTNLDEGSVPAGEAAG